MTMRYYDVVYAKHLSNALRNIKHSAITLIDVFVVYALLVISDGKHIIFIAY
jgi:hypothetical protein